MSDFPAAQAHGEIEQIVDGVHWVRGSAQMGPGMRIPRCMVVVVEGESLTLINAVRLSEDGERQLNELGKVKHVVKLGFFHDLDDAYFVEKYGAAYWALPRGTRKDKPSATEELSEAHLPLADASLFQFEKTKRPEGALLLNRAGGVLVTCDAIQNWPDTEGCSLLAKLVTRALGFTRRPAQIGPPWLKFMSPKDGSLQQDFERLAALDFKHMIAAHGGPLSDTAKQAVAATVTAKFA